MKRIICPMLLSMCVAAASHAIGIKEDLNPSDNRKDLLTPHWDNWPWHEGKSESHTFGDITVTLRAATNGTLSPVLFKGLLDYGATMAADGVAVKTPAGGGLDLVLSGLAPGKHSVAMYHNELRDQEPAAFDVSVDGAAKLKNVVPSVRATNDYEVASAFVEVTAQAGKDVVVLLEPEHAGQSVIINGFEIDEANPKLKAIKPLPANDDEHWPNESALTWTIPTGVAAHQLYLGTDSNAVANASSKSPEFKGNLSAASFALPDLDQMKT